MIRFHNLYPKLCCFSQLPPSLVIVEGMNRRLQGRFRGKQSDISTLDGPFQLSILWYASIGIAFTMPFLLL